MSDDAEQYFHAWKQVFCESGSKPNKILCAWYVDQSWIEAGTKALKGHVQSKEERTHIYHHLRTLLMETNEAKFTVMLQEFLTLIDDNHEAFYTLILAHTTASVLSNGHPAFDLQLDQLQTQT